MAPSDPKKVVITGGTGLVGTALTSSLQRAGFEVRHLSRGPAGTYNGVQRFQWDPANRQIDLKAFEGADTIVHLAGAGIADRRWTRKRKAEIISSRVDSALLIYENLKAQGKQLRNFISASGAGYYGAVTSEKKFTESDSAGNDFLGRTCVEWEAAADKFSELGARVVKLRTAVVLASEGGALPKLVKPIKLGAGAALGTGKQWMPWIHIDDLVQIYSSAVENDSISGAYNAASSFDVTNEEFTRTAADVLNRKILLPHVPAIFLKIILGELAVALLEGSRISNRKIREAGVEIKHNSLRQALQDLL